VGVADDHVAAVASHALELPARGRVFTRRRHDFDELVTDGKDGVDQAEGRNAGIAECDRQPKCGVEILQDGIEIVCDQRDLTESDHSPSGGKFGARFSMSAAAPSFASTRSSAAYCTRSISSNASG